MKKIKLTSGLLSILFLSSCVTQTFMVTDNPVGPKKGEASLKLFSKDADISLEGAAKNGKITKIGLVETRSTYILIFPKLKTTVYGESADMAAKTTEQKSTEQKK